MRSSSHEIPSGDTGWFSLVLNCARYQDFAGIGVMADACRQPIVMPDPPEDPLEESGSRHPRFQGQDQSGLPPVSWSRDA